ncbi:TM2 domain-containing protein [Paenibacillus sp. YYML68]|uniref:TM2 domain-containing protein n=1 Tax=Paenibacillus sp. YYML68 TaxID=2909250 RepID=UPI0024900305|nr:TM2 domain-containing protein [Paenibacillus sp. YYML68]
MDHLKEKSELTLEELGILESEMQSRRKSREAAWGLWAGLSFFGAHRFYTGDYAYASIMLLTSIIPLIGLLLLSTFLHMDGFGYVLLWFFGCLLAGSVIWSWLDAFFLNRRIDQWNHEEEARILQKINGLRK